MNNARSLKRQQIEDEIRGIVLSDGRAILADNLRRRNKRLGSISYGDTVLLFEYAGKKRKSPDTDGECLYRMIEGRVIQVTKSGFFIEGHEKKGRRIREFVNKAHIINGTVQLLLKEKL